jgi:hypothetical protein
MTSIDSQNFMKNKCKMSENHHSKQSNAFRATLIHATGGVWNGDGGGGGAFGVILKLDI